MWTVNKLWQVAVEAKWWPCRGSKAGELRRQRRWRLGWQEGVPLFAGHWPSPENFEFFNLEMACFGVFCSTKFNILVTTKSCKNHTLDAWGTRMDVTKRNRHLLSFFLTLANTNQLNTVTPSVMCSRDHDNNITQRQTAFSSLIMYYL